MNPLFWWEWNYGMTQSNKLNWAENNIRYLKNAIDNLDPDEVAKLFAQFKIEVEQMFSDFKTEVDTELQQAKEQIEQEITDLSNQLEIFKNEVRPELEGKLDIANISDGLIFDMDGKKLKVLIHPDSLQYLEVTSQGIRFKGGTPPVDIIWGKGLIFTDATKTVDVNVQNDNTKWDIYFGFNADGSMYAQFSQFGQSKIDLKQNARNNTTLTTDAKDIIGAINEVNSKISKNWWTVNGDGVLQVNTAAFSPTAPYKKLDISKAAFDPVVLSGIDTPENAHDGINFETLKGDIVEYSQGVCSFWWDKLNYSSNDTTGIFKISGIFSKIVVVESNQQIYKFSFTCSNNEPVSTTQGLASYFAKPFWFTNDAAGASISITPTVSQDVQINTIYSYVIVLQSNNLLLVRCYGNNGSEVTRLSFDISDLG